jgi:hypothetical protein
MKTTIEQLKKDGAKKGLCAEWQNRLTEETSIQKLCELYIQGIDFCISEDFPSLEILRRDFKGKCESYGVFIDDYIDHAVNKPDLVLNGSCEANLVYNGYTVSQLYIRHESTAKMIVSDRSVLTIDAFDESELYVNVLTPKCKVFVNIYGNAKVHTFGPNIKIRNTNKSTY